MSHANARLTPAGRLVLVERIAAGRPAAHVAAEMRVSRTTAWQWWRRWQTEGRAGLVDRSSVARTHPRRTEACTETRIRIWRHLSRRGPVFIAGQLRLSASTVGRVLARHHTPRLNACDPVTGQLIRTSRRSARRYEHDRPGDLIHLDVKKLGRIPDGGGWRAHGRSEAVRGRGNGWDYCHVAVDDHSRMAYVEVLPDERGTTCAAFLHRAASWFRDEHGVTIRRVLTDNAKSYRVSRDWIAVCSALQIKRRYIKPGCPWTNGKAERFNRTLQNRWAYRQPWPDNAVRTAALPEFLTYYNTARGHTGLAGATPLSRLAA